MKFYNMSKIMENVNIHNKYLLTTIIAERARQISRDQAALRDSTHEEKAISLALADMEAGNVTVHLQNDTIAAAIENEASAVNREEAAPSAE